MKIIALCVNVSELDQGGYKDSDICKKYPGSGWMPYLVQYAESRGYHVLSGSEAHQATLKLQINPKDTLVIQEENNAMGKTLIDIGALPALLFCLESPLFAPFFYDDIPVLKNKFKYQMLFQGGTHTVHFPSFDLNDLKEPEPMQGRNRICMVVSNKHYSFYEHLFKTSPSWDDAVKNELHSTRYLFLQAMSAHPNEFHLYGKGWPKDVGKEIPPGLKHDVIRHYEECICIENVAIEGYVTEKLFDCLVAGVAPRYIGAPDIHKFVPTDVIYEPGKPYLDVIASGQRFIHSDLAKKFSYQGFAEEVLNIIGT